MHKGNRVLALWAVFILTAFGVRSGGISIGAEAAVLHTQSALVTPQVQVAIALTGTESQPGYMYLLRIRCSKDSGAVVARANEFSGDFTLTALLTRSFGASEFPTLALSDSCVLTSLDSNGASVSYQTTVEERVDRSRPDALPGRISSDGFVSAPASANGQTITLRVAYTGDLSITQRVVSQTKPDLVRYETRVNCKPSGYSTSVFLGNGQQEIITGIPAGSVCLLSQPGPGGSAARFDDNSGAPNDASVVIVGTRATCWDLRNTDSSCRAVVIVTTVSNGQVPDPPAPDNPPPTTTPDQQREESPATTSAPAVSAAPAVAVEAEPAFTG